VSKIRRQWRHFIYKRVLHADDSPHNIALGVAIATFVALTPLMFFHTVIALAIAAILRANKAVCIPVVWITNFFTAIPIYGTCWALGKLILTGRTDTDRAALEQQLALPPEYSGWGVVTHLHEAAFWNYVLEWIMNFGAELWLGCTIIGGLSAAVLYFVSRQLIIIYRRRRAARKARKKLVRPSVQTIRPLKAARPRKSVCVE
jgi:uncharacterized protein (DUF2062 family)